LFAGKNGIVAAGCQLLIGGKLGAVFVIKVINQLGVLKGEVIE